MSKLLSLLFIFSFMVSCATRVENNYLEDVADVKSRSSENLGLNHKLELNFASKTEKLNEKARIILALSPETSLCLPEITEGIGQEFYLGFVHSMVMNAVFKENSADWERYRLSKELSSVDSLLNALKSLGVKQKSFTVNYISLTRLTKAYFSSDDELIRDLKLDIAHRPYSAQDIVVSDVDVKKFSGKIIEIRGLLKYKSIIQIKRQCKAIASEITQVI